MQVFFFPIFFVSWLMIGLEDLLSMGDYLEGCDVAWKKDEEDEREEEEEGEGEGEKEKRRK